MKKLILIITMLLSTSVFAQAPESLSCFYEAGGYDDETIELYTDQTTGEYIFEYVSYQGPTGDFKRIDPHTFVSTEEELVIYSAVSFSRDFKTATMLTVYKDGGDILDKQIFECK
ncbi:MAG: hypothetical protein ISR65_14160 [Bacteriovoracaceae bacterium]|nr:hypothetical protein [Bacteriovoracaceae bacterium]